MNKQLRYLFYPSIALAIATLPVHAESIDPVANAISTPSDLIRSSADITLSGSHEIGNTSTESPLSDGYHSNDSDAVLNAASANTADEVVAQASADISGTIDSSSMTIASVIADGTTTTAADTAPPTGGSTDPTMIDTSTSSVTPEPSTFWFVGSLALGVLLGRKRIAGLRFQ